MKQKIDFTIRESEDERLLFRFYPRRSHVHGFTDEPPKTWNKVYKTYFSWAIILQYKDFQESVILFEEDFDECSVLEYMPDVIDNLPTTPEETKTIQPFGDGVTWEFTFVPEDSWRGKVINKSGYKVILWQNYTNKGYRFFLCEDKLKEFKDKVTYILSYMLEHSEGI